MFYRLMMFLAFLLAFPLATEAAAPSIDLNFTFNPPMSITPTTPLTYLDVCSNPNCSALSGSIGLTCPVTVNPVTHASFANSCNLLVVPSPGNATMMMFTGPAYLRVRNGNYLSPPFYFPGGQPTIPPMVMRYLVSPSPTGFIVTGQ